MGAAALMLLLAQTANFGPGIHDVYDVLLSAPLAVIGITLLARGAAAPTRAVRVRGQRAGELTLAIAAGAFAGAVVIALLVRISEDLSILPPGLARARVFLAPLARQPGVILFFSIPLSAIAVGVVAQSAGTPAGDLLRLKLPSRATLPALGRAVPALVVWYVILSLGLGLLIPLPRWIAEQYMRLEPASVGEMAIFLLSVIVLAPVSEELILRGFSLSVLSDGLRRARAPWLRHPLIPVLITAALFGLLHVAPSKVIATGAFGIVLARLAIATRSILPGLVAHASANALAILLSQSVHESWARAFTGLQAGILVLVAVALAGPVFALLARVETAARDERDAAREAPPPVG